MSILAWHSEFCVCVCVRTCRVPCFWLSPVQGVSVFICPLSRCMLVCRVRLVALSASLPEKSTCPHTHSHGFVCKTVGTLAHTITVFSEARLAERVGVQETHRCSLNQRFCTAALELMRSSGSYCSMRCSRDMLLSEH